MPYIYLDESGDLGFDFTKKRTSKYFVITFLFSSQKKPIDKIVKKIFASFPPKQIRVHPGVLHAVKESPRTRQKLLNELARQDISILTIYLNKEKVYTKLQDEKAVLYNFVTNILLDRIMTKKLVPTAEPIILIASRRETNKFLNENFKSYLENQMRSNHKLDMQIEIKTPSQEKGLQVVDFASWAIFRKREYDDETYYNTIKNKIIEESPLFP